MKRYNLNYKNLLKLFRFIKYRFYYKFWIYFNRFKLSLNEVEYGKNVIIRNHFYLEKKENSRICIGNNVLVTSGGGYNPIGSNRKTYIFCNNNAEILIGDNAGMSNIVLWADSSIKIGNYVKLGANVVVIDTNCHSLNYKMRRTKIDDQNDVVSKAVVIEDDALIGTGSIILKGVTIGARSIIGAGSIVTQSIPADCIAAGNPCKIIKFKNTKNGKEENNSGDCML